MLETAEGLIFESTAIVDTATEARVDEGARITAGSFSLRTDVDESAFTDLYTLGIGLGAGATGESTSTVEGTSSVDIADNVHIETSGDVLVWLPQSRLLFSGDVVYVATGTGMAPIWPMLLETLARPETGRVALFWGLRHEDDLFWQDELQSLTARNPRFSAHIYLSQPRGFWRDRGRVVPPVLELLPLLTRPTFYLCGNGQMIEECKAALIARGVERKRQIRTEAFFD